MKRPYLNKAGFNKLAQSIKDYINRKITGYDKLGTASTKDFTTYVSPTQTEQLPISSSVYSAMTNMLRGAYHPAGSKTVAELTEDLLVKANLGNVYKITEDGVTSDLFIGGAGQTIKTGDNAVVLYASEDTYKFSLESGVVDLDAYQKKELTSGALIEDVIPTDASASNKLVTAQGLAARANITNPTVKLGVNLNEIKAAGYFVGKNDVTSTNKPDDTVTDWSLTVTREDNYNRYSQVFICYYTARVWVRTFNGASWSSWQKLVTESDLPVFPDYTRQITVPNGLTSWTVTENCYMSLIIVSASSILNTDNAIKIDGKKVTVESNTGGTIFVNTFNGFVKKGQVITGNLFVVANKNACKIYPLK